VTHVTGDAIKQCYAERFRSRML